MTASFPGSVKSFGADHVNGELIVPGDVNDLRAEVVAIETAMIGGWMAQSETWTYASASTFTVAGDRTGFYTRGMRLRWVQGGTTKYGVVASSSYGAPSTTVTIHVNTDYVVANAAITAQSVSYLGDPVGWPGWFNWTPVLNAGPAILSGYSAARFNINGRMVTFDFKAENKNFSGSAGYFGFSLPVAASASIARLRAVAQAYPVGGIYVPVRADFGAGSSVMAVFKDFTSANWLASETGIYIYVSASYEI